ncbi:hypothetical protein [Thermotalea metallivorans]|uniref:Uncharacterized protein n=1 Tax=Thermotalea metallivorans TaxID=520762 RepID=A0A140L9X8_9FIRM|nr:hypothetical protein [Thermotalea metallivorans]KXG77353.1 hypothetical protein AN619_04790 [Thermotalea metallivorans]
MAKMKYWLMALLLWLLPVGIYADTFQDTFNDKTKIDIDKTGVAVDTTNGYLSLPKNPMPNALAMKEFGYEYAVVVENGVKFFSFDGAGMVENPFLSIGSITNPLGVALREDQQSIWVLTDTELKRYDYNGSDMVYNPFLSITGLSNPISISAQPADDFVAILSKDGEGKGVISYFGKDENGQIISIPFLSMNTNIMNPVSISLVKNSYDLVIASSDAIYYYAYDGTGLIQNPFLTITGQENIVSFMAAGDELQYKILKDDSKVVESYLLSGTGMDRVDILSKTNLPESIAMSIKPGSFDFGLLTETGDIQYYSFDGSTYIRNYYLEVTGLNITQKYRSPKEYQSIEFKASKLCDTARLVVTEEVLENTSIQYYISTDSGSTWVPIIPNTWIDTALSDKFKIRAVFSTDNDQITPKLYDIALEVTRLDIKNLMVTNISLKYPEQEVPTNIFPVVVKAGTEVIFTVETEGYAKAVSAAFTTGKVVDLVPSSTDNDTNTWTGSFIIPVNIDDGNFIGITATADRDGKQKSITENGFLIINGQAFFDVDLILVE